MCHSTRIIYSVCAHHSYMVTECSSYATGNQTCCQRLQKCRTAGFGNVPHNATRPESNVQVVMGWCNDCTAWFKPLNVCLERAIANFWALRASLRMPFAVNPATIDPEDLFAEEAPWVEERGLDSPTWEERAIADALGLWSNPKLTRMECNYNLVCERCVNATLNGTHTGLWIKGIRAATLEWATRTGGGDKEFNAEYRKLKRIKSAFQSQERQRFIQEERKLTLQAHLEAAEQATENEKRRRQTQSAKSQHGKQQHGEKRRSPAKLPHSKAHHIRNRGGPPPPAFCGSPLEEKIVTQWHRAMEIFHIAGPRPPGSSPSSIEKILSPKSSPHVQRELSADESTVQDIPIKLEGEVSVIEVDKFTNPRPAPVPSTRPIATKANSFPSLASRLQGDANPYAQPTTALRPVDASGSVESSARSSRRNSAEESSLFHHGNGKIRPPPRVSRNHLKCSVHGEWKQGGCAECFRRIINERSVLPGKNSVSEPGTPVGERGEFVWGVQALCFCHLGGVDGCHTCSVREASKKGGLTWI